MNSSDAQQADYQRPRNAVEIIATGMLTPVGANTDMTAASVLAGISAYQASSILNHEFNPMTLAMVPDDALPPLDETLTKLGLTGRQQRLLRLATTPMQQLLEHLQEPVPLMLCGPEKIPGRHSVISDKFIQYLAAQTQAPIDLANSYVFPDGRAAGLYALESAMLLLEQGRCNKVIIGGIDSYIDLHLLGALDKEDRVLAEGVMDGFAPGEAAAFLLLQAAGPAPGVKIFPPGIGEEVGHRFSDQPYLGDGLSAAVGEALNTTAVQPAKTVFSSFNGENFSAKEWSVAAIRNQASLDPGHQLIHPADCYGDIGAATIPVLLSLACLGMEKGYYPGPSLVWASSEYQQRAAVYLATSA